VQEESSGRCKRRCLGMQRGAKGIGQDSFKKNTLEALSK
jgi:hypothetical protein